MYQFSEHAKRRMEERKISHAAIRNALASGAVIQEGEKEIRIYRKQEKIFHVVLHQNFIITAWKEKKHKPVATHSRKNEKLRKIKDREDQRIIRDWWNGRAEQ